MIRAYDNKFQHKTVRTFERHNSLIRKLLRRAIYHWKALSLVSKSTRIIHFPKTHQKLCQKSARDFFSIILLMIFLYVFAQTRSNYTPNNPYAMYLHSNCSGCPSLIILQIRSQYLKFIKNTKTYRIE